MKVKSASFRSGIFLLLLAFSPHPSMAQSPALDDGSNEPLWTQKPVKIDRRKQSFPRLPSKQVVTARQSVLEVPKRIVVVDSTSFAFGGVGYRVADVEPIALKRVCHGSDGHRWTCGRLGALFLGRMVRGKRMFCDILTAANQTKLIGCTVGTQDLASAIIINGYGRAAGGAKLIALQDKAIQKHTGIWENPACVSSFETC